jgi:hypothetical protein
VCTKLGIYGLITFWSDDNIYFVLQWVSDCCLTWTQQFSAMSWREQVNFQWDDDVFWTHYPDSEPKSRCYFSVMMRVYRKSKKYQLHRLWFDPIEARTHDLPHSRRSNPRSTTLEAIQPTIYHTRGDHAHHNTTDARINIHIVLPHRYKTADTIDMSLYLSWFWAKTVFVLTPEGCVLCTGATHTKCSLGSGLENCHTRGQHANYYTTEALLILNNVR